MKPQDSRIYHEKVQNYALYAATGPLKAAATASISTGLPENAPDTPVTTIVLECDGPPVQDTDFVRVDKPRAGVGI